MDIPASQSATADPLDEPLPLLCMPARRFVPTKGLINGIHDEEKKMAVLGRRGGGHVGSLGYIKRALSTHLGISFIIYNNHFNHHQVTRTNDNNSRFCGKPPSTLFWISLDFTSSSAALFNLYIHCNRRLLHLARSLYDSNNLKHAARQTPSAYNNVSSGPYCRPYGRQGYRAG